VRQVPKYLVIGNGRMAKHMAFYFASMELLFSTWARSRDSLERLDILLQDATHVLVLISDAAIEPFIKQHLFDRHPHLLVCHFSGALVSAYAASAHPLQTFSDTLYPIESYHKIPFFTEEGKADFPTLFPTLSNPHYKIGKQSKSYYHALCVLANNFSVLLWQKFMREMQERFEVDYRDLTPFLQQTFMNLAHNPLNALTGPFARQDTETLFHNMEALKDDKFIEIFKAFVNTFIEEI
jgi:predicted short-subunit dehydrogenase-like oxidoreductase (DUF2520 family)